MDVELRNGISLESDVVEEFADFCSLLNNLSSDLDETWLNNRCGFQSENTIVLNAVGGLPTLALSQNFRQLNGDCTELLEKFKTAKATK